MEGQCTKNPKLLEKETEEGMMLFNVDSGTMVQLNPVAALLWQKSGATFCKADLRNIITEHTEGADNIDQDLTQFIEHAIKHKLVDTHEN